MKMLPMHHRSDGKWDKWGVNNMSKVLAVALLLLMSLQILTWRKRPLMGFPCSLNSQTVVPQPLSSDLETNPSLDGVLAMSQAADKLKVVQEELELTKSRLQVAEDELRVGKAKEEGKVMLPVDSYFPNEDSDLWACRQHHADELNMTYRDWVTGGFTDQQALCAAHRHAKRPMAAGTPRIAFLFLTRGEIPTEPLWRKFFAGHEEEYSIYIHSTDPDHEFPPGSIFRDRGIPSKPIDKVKTSLPEAFRRLFAYALLDSTTPNAWFHILSESSIPIRPFSYVYNYITNSEKSFVESFYPTSPWWRLNWNTTGDMAIPEHLMRKGEAWVTVHRRHAGLIVGDNYIFPRFKHHWYEWGLPSEIYIPTLLAITDAQSIANRSLVYVNWKHSPLEADSPVQYNHTTISSDVIVGIQNLTSNVHGFYRKDKRWNDTSQESCIYNGVPNSPCFLFARKFSRHPDCISRLVSLSPVLGYS